MCNNCAFRVGCVLPHNLHLRDGLVTANGLERKVRKIFMAVTAFAPHKHSVTVLLLHVKNTQKNVSSKQKPKTVDFLPLRPLMRARRMRVRSFAIKVYFSALGSVDFGRLAGSGVLTCRSQVMMIVHRQPPPPKMGNENVGNPRRTTVLK